MDALKLLTIALTYYDDVLGSAGPADVAYITFTYYVHDLMPFMINFTPVL